MKKKLSMYLLMISALTLILVIYYNFNNKSNIKDSNSRLSYNLASVESTMELEIWDAQINEDTVYVLTSSGINRLDDNLMTLLDYPGQKHDLFSIYKNYIYLLKDQATTIEVFEIGDNILIEKSSIPLPISNFSYADRIKIIDDILYISLNNKQSHSHDLYGYDLNNKQWSENAIIENIIEFLPISNGEFIIATENQNITNISIFTSADKAQKLITEYTGSIWDISLINDSVYIGGSHGLSKLSLNDNIVEHLIKNIYFDEKYSISRALSKNDEIFLLSGDSYLYALISKTIDSSYDLKFSTNIEHFDEVLPPPLISSLKSLHNTYPDLNCSFIPTENYNDTIRLQLMSKSKDFDAYIIPITELLTLNNEFLQDLSNYPLVNTSLSATFAGVKRSSSSNNKILGIPKDIQTECFSINTDFKKYLDISSTTSLEWTWNDFIDQSYQHRKDINNDGIPDLYLTNWSALEIMDYILPTYIIESAQNTFNIESLKILLETVKTAHLDGILKDFKDFNRFTTQSDILLDTRLLTQYIDPQQGDFLLFPTLTKDNAIYLLNGSLYVPNPFSEKIDLTVELLTTSLEPRNYLPQMSSVWFNDPEHYETYSSDDSSTGIQTIDMNSNIFDLFNRAFENGYPSPPCIHTLELVDTIESYLNNSISVDELMNIISSKLNQL